MPVGTQAYTGQKLFPEPAVFTSTVQIASGGALKLAAGVPFTQAGSATTPAGATGTSAVFTTAAGQPGYVNPQGLVVLESGVVSGSVLTAASPVANTTAESQLMGLSIPAGDPAAGAVYAISLAGVYSDTLTPTLAFGLRYGGPAGTSICAIAAITLGTGVTGVPFDLDAVLQFYSPTSAVGKIRLGLGTSAATGATSPFTASPTAPVAVTSATAKVMSVTVTWSAASASNTISALTGYGARLA